MRRDRRRRISSQGMLDSRTLTLVFTDIEGSTRLLEELGDGYAPVLAAHRALIRKAAAAHEGEEVDCRGDGFFLAFPDPDSAASFALKAEQSIATHEWPVGEPLRVRIGIHEGEARTGEEGYVGLDVHRAARIAEAFGAPNSCRSGPSASPGSPSPRRSSSSLFPASRRTSRPRAE
jgi:class 3 adenylate cyclase